MRLSHPGAPFQGVPAQDVFFAANDQFVQMGHAFVIVNMQEEMYPERPLQLFIDIQAQPSARNLLLGAVLARSEQIRAAYPPMKGRIYTEIAPTQFDLVTFYNQNGFSSNDAREEYIFPLPTGAAQPPMGCEFASVPLLTVEDQYAFLARLNRNRLSPISHDFLTLQMQQPYFLALGYYRAGHPIAEILMTGATPDTAALVMLYVQKDMRRRGVGKSLLIAASDLLRQRHVTSALTQGFSGNQAQAGLLRSLGATRRRIINVVPHINLG
ncbi:MAG: GNAT family N-acetyltransferase [Clostridiales bacterium]|jgi:GNAT superfamily N-acetyltransferase|nr:GNAT family N-acetyltransferase [Clostridiales bacterium]